MRILDRLVVRSFLRLFLLFVFTAPLLFIVGDITENLDRYLGQGMTLGDTALSYVYEYPKFLSWAFPFASLLAAVFTIHPMTAHREVMAAKAGGISFHRLAAPLLPVGLVLTAAGLGLAELAPRATRIAGDLRGDRPIGQAWRNDFVYVTDSGQSLSVRRLTVDDGRMIGVSLQELPRDPEAPVRHIQAGSARFWSGEGWLFQDGYSREVHADSTEVTVGFEMALIRSLTERPEDLLEMVRDEDEMTYADLRDFGDRLLRSGGDVGRTRTKMEERVAVPAATLVIILFAAPLATSFRRGGTAFGVGVSLATAIVYMVLLRISENLGYAGVLDPQVAAWLPNAFFLVIGLLLIRWVRT